MARAANKMARKVPQPVGLCGPSENRAEWTGTCVTAALSERFSPGGHVDAVHSSNLKRKWAVKSPSRAEIRTLPSTSFTSNSVQRPVAGDTVTPPARVASDFEVETDMPPCSSLTLLPSY
jgi:hypothetical protein